MTKIKAIVVILVIVASGLGLWHLLKQPPKTPVDLYQIEPVVLSTTSSLLSFLKANPASSTRSLDLFAKHIAKTKPRNYFMVSSFTLDLKHKNSAGILIVKDKKTGKLLFEDGTWPANPALDAPHWRNPGLPRLDFPDS